MKRSILSYIVLFLLFVLLLKGSLFGQEHTPAINIGASSGSNNFTSYIGVLGEAKIIKNLTGLAGVGYGYWGVKGSFGLRYYQNYPKGVYYGLSFSVVSGKDDDTLRLETANNLTHLPQGKQLVEFNLKQTQTINLSVGYSFRISKVIRLFIETGYSIPLKSDAFEIKDPQGVSLTEASKQVIYQYEPSGLIFGWGIVAGF